MNHKTRLFPKSRRWPENLGGPRYIFSSVHVTCFLPLTTPTSPLIRGTRAPHRPRNDPLAHPPKKRISPVYPVGRSPPRINSMSQPPMMLIPTNSMDLSLTLQGNERRHFISRKEFDVWSKSHPSVRPAPQAAGPDGAPSKGYR